MARDGRNPASRGHGWRRGLRTKFCAKGHDKDVVGRTGQGKCKVCHRLGSRRSDPAIKRRDRAGHLRKQYGLTIDLWDRMLASQAGRCDCCGEPMHRPVVDHNHATGAVRALVCTPCNVTIGFVEKRSHTITLAEAYLRRHS